MKPNKALKYIFAVCMLGVQTISLAESREMSAGAIVGMAIPGYGKFNTFAKDESAPGFPKMMMITGGQATFSSRGLLTGGRVIYGNTKSQSTTSGSSYSMYSLGFLGGYKLDMGAADLSFGLLLSIGETSFARGMSTNGSLVEVAWLGAEPQLMFGLNLTSNFKLSLGGAYQYGLPHSINQYGTPLFTNPSDIKISGILGMIQVSFGVF